MGKKATYLLGKALFAGMTYVFGLLALVGCLASVVPPRSSWFVSFVALGITPIILVNVAFFLIWVVKWRWIALVPLLAIALNWGYISAMIQVDFRNEDNLPLAELRVASYNIHGYVHKDFNSTMTDILEYFDNKSVDLACVQEFYKVNDSIVDSVWRTFYPYKVVVSEIRGMQLAVFSKYPIVNHKYFKFSATANGAMYVDVDVNDRRLRIFNLHLQTTNVNQSQGEIAQIRNLGIDNPQGKEAFDSIMDRMSDNASLRVEQVNMICDEIEATQDRLVVVCGDFNDIPSSYTYRKISDGLEDGFRSAGSGYAYTFKDMYKLFRLDYILHDKEIRTIKYGSEYAPWSDHNPVFAEFSFR